MTLKQFIHQNKSQIDAEINQRLGYVPSTASCYCPKSGTNHQHEPRKLNYDTRRGWVLNDEGLYNWARSSGVPI